MKTVLHITLLTLLGILVGCRHSGDLLSEEHPIPFLADSDPDVLSIIDQSDPSTHIGQRIVWEVDHADDIAMDSIIAWGGRGYYGGLILKGYSLSDYLHIRSSLEDMVPFPMLYGTDQSHLINGQFSDASHAPSTVQLAALQDKRTLTNLERQFRIQHDIFGINFSASILNRSFDPSHDWGQSYNAWKDDVHSYVQRISDFNSGHILTLFDEFDQDLIPLQDSSSIEEGMYANLIPCLEEGVSAVLVDLDLHYDGYGGYRAFFDEKLNYKGIIAAYVDSQEDISKAVSGEVDLLIVGSSDIKKMHNHLSNESSRIASGKYIDRSFQKVLLAKYWAESKNPIIDDDYSAWLSVPQIKHIDEASAALVHNYRNLLPFTSTYNRDFRMISYGTSPLDTMEMIMHLFADHKRTFYNTQFQKKLPTFPVSRYRYATVVFTLDDIDIDATKDQEFIKMVNEMSHTRKVALVNFGNPFNLAHFDSTVTSVQLYDQNAHTQKLAAHALFGGVSLAGHFPISLDNHIQQGDHVEVPTTRWRYVDLDDVGIDEKMETAVSKLVRSAIKRKAFSGCQIMAVHSGKVLINQSYGHHTYSRRDKMPVRDEDLFDLASITKVAATTLATMRLYEEGHLKLESKVSEYLAIPEDSEIGTVSIKHLLTHTSGIQAAMPTGFIVNQNKKDSIQYLNRDALDDIHPIKVADKVYYRDIIHDSLWQHVIKLSAPKKSYVYSDVNFYLLQKIIEKITGEPLDEYAFKSFYRPMGLTRTDFTPLDKFEKNDIVPTQNDKKWRKQLLQGYVHDPTAALLAGVSGNAGLFSNAHDLAVIGQMLLNGGEYGGRRYFKNETVDLFTKANFVSNRGLGFDSNNDGSAKVADKASSATYGHLGFTGTALWVDPENELVFTFLSNRIHPNQRNTTLIKQRYRQRIQNVILEQLQQAEEKVERVRAANSY